MQRLSMTTLHQLPVSIRQPSYDRGKLSAGIVHLGLGAFHRAHQAYYTEDVLERGDKNWGTIGVSLRSTETRDALLPQDCLYTLSERDHAGESLRIVGGLLGARVAPDDPQRLIELMSSPNIKIVSMTVTEKGYCHHPALGELNEDHPDVRFDLEHPNAPRTILGYIASALAERKQQGVKPFTVLTCDNLPANGRTVKSVLTRFAEMHSPELGRFVRDEVACPSTMLDRIVPATTAADRERVSAASGLIDAWPVVTERFTQWVIEDDFPAGRPDWAATFVQDVAPYELMKLRLLNGAHSSLAYLGYLCGRETVADAMADLALGRFVDYLMTKEVLPTLKPPPGENLVAYKNALLQRFQNPALRHRTWQIAMDGSQKLPQRLLGTIRDRLAHNLPIDGLALGVAAWMRYVTGVDEQGQPIDMRDPLKDELRRRTDRAGLIADRLAPELLGVEQIFGKDLPQRREFTKSVTSALESLLAIGSQRTIENFVRNHS